MELMGLANFQSVFIGIETPNEDSLRETKKLQNVRPNAGTLLERVHRVQGARHRCLVRHDRGLRPRRSVDLQGHAELPLGGAHLGGPDRHAARDPDHAALRPAQEGRAPQRRRGQRSNYGTNVIPLGMSREALARRLRRGDADLLRAGRLFPAARCAVHRREFQVHPASAALLEERIGLAWAKRCFSTMSRFTVLVARLLSHRRRTRRCGRRYRQQLSRVLRTRWREPHILFIYAIKVGDALPLRRASRARSPQVEAATGVMPDAGRSFSRVKRRVEVQAVA